MKSNFQAININYSGATGITTQVTLSLVLTDSTNQLLLLDHLQKNNAFVKNEITYAFNADIVPAKITVDQKETSTTVIQIKLPLMHAEKILNHLQQSLYNFGYGFSLHELYQIRCLLSINAEEFYLARAIKIIRKMAPNDNPMLPAFHELMLLAFEMPIMNMINFLPKMADVLRKHNFFKCATAATIPYENIGKPLKNNAERIDWDGEGSKRELFLVLPKGAYRDTLVDCLKTNNAVEFNGNKYQFSVYIGKTRKEPAGIEAIIIASTKEQIAYVIARVFEILQNNNYFIPHHARNMIREAMGINNIEGYKKSADIMINNLLKSGDIPGSLEYCQLLALTFEIDVNNRAAFVYEISRTLFEKEFTACAFGLSSLYKNDPLCKSLGKLHKLLDETLSTQDSSQQAPAKLVRVGP